MRCINVVVAWGACGARERCLGLRYRGMRCNIYSRTSREVEALLDQLVATCTPHLRRTAGPNPPLLVAQAPLFFLHFILLLTLRATRAPYRSLAGPPSNYGIPVRADVTHDEYERHRACPSVKPSTDQPSHVPLHARTLRGAALSS